MSSRHRADAPFTDSMRVRPQYWEHLDALGRMLRGHATDTIFNLSPFGPTWTGTTPKAQSPVRLWFELFEDGVRQVVIRRTVKRRELDEFCGCSVPMSGDRGHRHAPLEKGTPEHQHAGRPGFSGRVSNPRGGKQRAA